MSLFLDLELLQEDTESAAIPWTQRLLARVLRRAAVDYALGVGTASGKLHALARDAEAWIFGARTEFTFYCRSLGLEPEVVRQYMRALTPDEARALRGLEFGDHDRGGA